jgi:hypothetical protein
MAMLDGEKATEDNQTIANIAQIFANLATSEEGRSRLFTSDALGALTSMIRPHIDPVIQRVSLVGLQNMTAGDKPEYRDVVIKSSTVDHLLWLSGEGTDETKEAGLTTLSNLCRLVSTCAS